jgi:hypothetical protein
MPSQLHPAYGALGMWPTVDDFQPAPATAKAITIPATIHTRRLLII